jgi:hypothetical protein
LLYIVFADFQPLNLGNCLIGGDIHAIIITIYPQILFKIADKHKHCYIKGVYLWIDLL